MFSLVALMNATRDGETLLKDRQPHSRVHHTEKHWDFKVCLTVHSDFAKTCHLRDACTMALYRMDSSLHVAA